MKKIIGIFVCVLLSVFMCSTIVVADNSPPNPPLIEGPTNGNIDEFYNFTITLTDPDIDDQMFYLEVDFGDYIIYEDCGCGKAWQNGEIITVSHSWKKAGSYNVTARVQDSMGEWSEWSDSLPVSMPKTVGFFDRLQNIPIFEKIIKIIHWVIKI